MQVVHALVTTQRRRIFAVNACFVRALPVLNGRLSGLFCRCSKVDRRALSSIEIYELSSRTRTDCCGNIAIICRSLSLRCIVNYSLFSLRYIGATKLDSRFALIFPFSATRSLYPPKSQLEQRLSVYSFDSSITPQILPSLHTVGAQNITKIT